MRLVSDASDTHKIEVDLTELRVFHQTNFFTIIVEDESGKTYTSEIDEFEIPKEILVEGGSNFLMFCLFGGVVFALPSPVYVMAKEAGVF